MGQTNVTALLPLTDYDLTVLSGSAGVLSANGDPLAADVTTVFRTAAADDLVGAWTFAEGAGSTAADSSGNGNTLAINDAAWATGHAGPGLQFDGVNDRAMVAHADTLNVAAALTLAAWVQPIGPSAGRSVISKPALGSSVSYQLGFTETDRAIAYLRGADGMGHVSLDAALPLGGWSHLAVTYDGTWIRLYLNGDLRAITDLAGPLVTSTAPVYVGGDQWGDYFGGAIDDLRIYARALSADEITALLPHAATPTIAPAAGTYAVPQLVTLATTTPGATIHYTLDGTTPSAASAVYSGGVVVDSTATIKAIASLSGWADSAVAATTLTITPGPLTTPIASPPAGWVQPSQLITLQADPGTQIRYTLDGSDPTVTSPLYTAAITVPTDNTTLHARAFRTNWPTSAASSDVYRLDSTAPTITARQSPSAFHNWQLTPVTVTFTCADNVGVSTCPPPLTVSTEGANQTVSGVVVDGAGNQAAISQTLNLDFTPPLLTITAPTGTPSTTDSSVLITAAVSDALSGVARVTCDGAAATITNGQATCTVPLRPGLNDIAVVATDVAGNTKSAGLRIRRSGTSTGLTLSPMTQSILVDESLSLTLADEFGSNITGATWSSDEPSIVSVSADDPPVLQGLGLGSATITAAKNGLVAHATVTVIAGTVFPDGVARWTLDGSPGFDYWGVLNTNRVDPAVPEMFTFEMDSASNMIVRGVSAEGRAQSVVAASAWPLMGDSFGALVGHTGGNAFSSLYGSDNRYQGFARFAGPASAVPWRYESLDSIGTPAQAPDGTIYVLEKFRVGTNVFQQLAIIETQLLAIDGATGVVKRRYTLDRERRNVISGAGTFQCAANYEAIPETAGPIVGNDGAGYLLVRTQYQVQTHSCPDLLASQDVGVKLLRMSPDGDVTSTLIYSHHCNRGSIDPEVCDAPPVLGDLLPDGAGGILARVTYTTSATFGWLQPSFTFDTKITRITPDGVQYTQSVGLDDRIWMIGDGGTAFTIHNDTWQAMDVVNWTPKWTNANLDLEPVTGLVDGGVAMHDLGTDQLVQFDASGTQVPATAFGGRWGYQTAFGFWTSSEWGLTARPSLPLAQSSSTYAILGGVGTGQNAPITPPGRSRDQDDTAIALMRFLLAPPVRLDLNGNPLEQSGHICKEPDGDHYHFQPLPVGTSQTSVGLRLVPEQCAVGTTVGFAHSHPGHSLYFEYPSGFISQLAYFDINHAVDVPHNPLRSDLWIADDYFDHPEQANVGPTGPEVMWYVTSPKFNQSFVKYKKTDSGPARFNIRRFDFATHLWGTVTPVW